MAIEKTPERAAAGSNPPLAQLCKRLTLRRHEIPIIFITARGDEKTPSSATRSLAAKFISVCTENLVWVDSMMESPKLAE
jgi:FixJ family two-component response regulator